MIKRIFKTIFILSLCLGTILPANAGSAQVSDGSAFITKSEMAYELNNLSSRMTQLENSLDSKIDTLVSSYLTRNGIWNGVKQQIVYTGVNQGLGWTTSSNAKMLHQYFDTDYSYHLQLIDDPYTLSQLGSSRSNVACINKISKTGLLKLTYNLYRTSYNDGSKTDVLSIQPSIGNGSYRYAERNFCIVQIYYYLHQDAWVNPESSSLGVVYNDCTSFASVIPNIENYGLSTYTFVEKDKPLYVTEELRTNFPDSNRTSWKAAGVHTVKGSIVFKFEPVDAKVY